MRRSAPFGVVLLEAIISLVVIAGVAGACVGLRSQSIRQRIAVERALGTDNALSTLLTEATAGLLDAPIIETGDDGSERRVWRGERFGEPYEIRAAIVEVRNPLSGRDAETPERMAMRQWTVTIGGESLTELRLATP